VSFLPYSHAAERIFGQCTRILVGMPAALIEEPGDLFTVAAHYEPTLFGALPRIFERLYEAAAVAEQTGADPRAAIAQRIGRRVRLATSGGAALPVAVAERLDALGLRILGAYGQTEHLCVAMNRPSAPRFDTVGTPMPGTVLRVDDTGELQIARSALTFSGYWARPEQTAAAFTDDGAWLRTGDQAALLPDGSVRITGRVKELIALSTGRKVAPLPIEAALTATPLVAHAVVYGEGRKYLVALVALRQDMVVQWAAARGLDTAWPALAAHPAVEAEVQAALASVNAGLARTDRVQAVTIVPDAFTVENGLLTPTLKVMRRTVESRYQAQFDALYRRGGGGP
jgi:long-chain acyl-CoA synthetase